MKKQLSILLFTTLFIAQPFQAQCGFFDFFSSVKNNHILQKKIETMIKKADQKENLGKRTKKYLEILKVITTQPGSQKIKEGLFKKTKKQLIDILKNNNDVDQSTIDAIKKQIFKLKKQLKKKQLKKNSKPTSSTFASKIKKIIGGYIILSGIGGFILLAASHNNREYGGGGQGGNNGGGAGGKGGGGSNGEITPNPWPIFNFGDGTGGMTLGGQNNNIFSNGAADTNLEVNDDQEDQNPYNPTYTQCSKQEALEILEELIKKYQQDVLEKHFVELKKINSTCKKFMKNDKQDIWSKPHFDTIFNIIAAAHKDIKSTEDLKNFLIVSHYLSDKFVDKFIEIIENNDQLIEKYGETVVNEHLSKFKEMEDTCKEFMNPEPYLKGPLFTYKRKHMIYDIIMKARKDITSTEDLKTLISQSHVLTQEFVDKFIERIEQLDPLIKKYGYEIVYKHFDALKGLMDPDNIIERHYEQLHINDIVTKIMETHNDIKSTQDLLTLLIASEVLECDKNGVLNKTNIALKADSIISRAIERQLVKFGNRNNCPKFARLLINKALLAKTNMNSNDNLSIDQFETTYIKNRCPKISDNDIRLMKNDTTETMKNDVNKKCFINAMIWAKEFMPDEYGNKKNKEIRKLIEEWLGISEEDYERDIRKKREAFEGVD